MTIPDSHDPWDYVRQHIPAAVDELSLLPYELRGIEALMEARFRKGHEEYRGDWLTRPPDWFDAMAAEELADWLTYKAMKRVIEDSA